MLSDKTAQFQLELHSMMLMMQQGQHINPEAKPDVTASLAASDPAELARNQSRPNIIPATHRMDMDDSERISQASETTSGHDSAAYATPENPHRNSTHQSPSQIPKLDLRRDSKKIPVPSPRIGRAGGSDTSGKAELARFSHLLGRDHSSHEVIATPPDQSLLQYYKATPRVEKDNASTSTVQFSLLQLYCFYCHCDRAFPCSPEKEIVET